uniref:Inositol polyphosphate-related phosphatase domain-containing protein n=1 Tax=Plectus sambesii TaxID=2011161 RepID=A0A914WY46_9BILA
MSSDTSSNSSSRRRRRKSSLAARVHSHVKLDGRSAPLGLPEVERPCSSSVAAREPAPVVVAQPVDNPLAVSNSRGQDALVNSNENLLSDSSLGDRSLGDGKDSSTSELMEATAASRVDDGLADGTSMVGGKAEVEGGEQFALPHVQHLFGPGGSILAGRSDVRAVLPNETATILCLTWNLAEKSPRSADSLRAMLHPPDVQASPDIYCISFQEVASTDMCFHTDVITLIAVAVGNDHIPFCWVRQWSQMLLILVRKTLLPFISDPERRFISSNVWTKPVKTKGAIAVCFRLFYTVILVVGCHLSYGPQTNRVNDYKKISQSLRFDRMTKSNKPAVQSANVVIWFGDLNFRITDRLAVDALLVTEPTAAGVLEGREDSHWSNVLINDQLSSDMITGKIFQEFKEAPIRFAPTHKLIVGTSKYNPRRVPSYTDRVLYRNNTTSSTGIVPLVYNSVWSETRSDHKPVYAAFLMRVIKEQRA